MYADMISDSMKHAIDETERRRVIQMEYNSKHNITPKTIIKAIPEVISIKKQLEDVKKPLTKKEMQASIKELERKMYEAAKVLDFERAMELRDIILEMKAGMK